MSDSNRDDRRTDSPPDVTDDREKKTGTDVDSGTGVGDRDDPGRDHRDESTQIANEERRRKTSMVSLIVAVLGAWVALSVLVYDVAAATLWNNVLVGAVVFLAAGYNYYRLNNDVPLSVGIAVLVALLGIWLIVAPALFGMTTGPFWSTLVTGLLIAGLAGYNAYDAREARAVATEPEAEPP
ncbi:SPW repeat domain-containing protein [Halosolutus halophilus]|uniref:SPW repeat domain-containing protein n=1 Tax=Halosolutus halophilus TaxID=1552990 RepID=UPI0022352738|nr:SPW repeat protein [Halosolutus halophilus]